MNQIPKECLEHIKSQNNIISQARFTPRSSVIVNIGQQQDTSKFHSPSEARISRLIYLVSIGLSDSEIKQEMNNSSGLHWQKKPHLHNSEIEKARRYVMMKRGRYGNY